MDHFQGVTPEERWKNDMLQELRKLNQALERNAQASEPKKEVRRGGRPRKGAVNQ